MIAANDVFRSYCATGCENLAERAGNQNNCLQNVTQPANLTSDEKAVRCTDAQNAVYCAVDAGKGCEFTSNYLNLSLSSIQQTIDKIVQPVTCTLHLVKQITTPPTTSPTTTSKQTTSSSIAHTVNTATQSAPVTNELSPQTYTATLSASATQLAATQSSADPGNSQSTTSVTTSEQSTVTAESATNQQSSQSNAQPTVTQPANAQVTMVSPTQASTTSGTTVLQVDVAFMTWTAMLVALKIVQKNIA